MSTLTTRDLTVARRWVAARIRFLMRNPRVLVFTFAFPLILIVLFTSLNGDTMVAAPGDIPGQIEFSQFYTPSIAIFSLTTACYTSMIVGLATAKETGVLKRVYGTPLPMPIYLLSWIVGAMLTGIAAVVLLFAVAVPAFGVDIFPRTLPAAIVTLTLGAACLASLGIAVSTLVKTADQAMPAAQLTFLPLSFISGIFFPLDGAPDWLLTVAKAFPLYHIVQAFDRCFVPQVKGGAWSGSDLLVIAIWTAVGAFVAVRRFQASPEAGRGAVAGALMARFRALEASTD